MARKTKRLVLKPFSVKAFLPKTDPFVTGPKGEDIPVKWSTKLEVLPASGAPVEAAAMVGYIAYLESELGPMDTWPDILAAGKGELDKALQDALKDAVPMADHKAALAERVLKVTRDENVADAVKKALVDAVTKEDHEAAIEEAKNEATADMISKTDAAHMVSQAQQGMITEADHNAEIQELETEMSKMVSKADAKDALDKAVVAATQGVTSGDISVEDAVEVVKNELGVDLTAMISAQATSKKKPAASKQQVKRRGVMDFLKEQR